MKITDTRLRFSATDLSNHLACPQISLLDRQVAHGALARPRSYDDPMLDVLRKRGQEHERAFLDELRCKYGADSVVETGDVGVDDYSGSSSVGAIRTVEAMESGARVIYCALPHYFRANTKLTAPDRPGSFGT